jgi:hypothetical protein
MRRPLKSQRRPRWRSPLSTEALDMLSPDDLKRYFNERQQRYAGTVAPPFTARFVESRRTPPHLVRLEHNVTITVDQAAFAMEMMLSPTSLQQKTNNGEKAMWFGADVLQNPIDSAMIASHLALHKPDLLLEVGTECGGSALFFLSLMKQYNPLAKLITWDVLEPYKRSCASSSPKLKGYRQPAFKRFVKEGSLIPRVAEVGCGSHSARALSTAIVRTLHYNLALFSPWLTPCTHSPLHSCALLTVAHTVHALSTAIVRSSHRGVCPVCGTGHRACRARPRPRARATGHTRHGDHITRLTPG